MLADGGRATLDATAHAAGVSKGGLLYHFPSKEALEAGLVDRLEALVTDDITRIESAPEGPVAYFLQSSVMDDDPLDRAIVAVSRLAQAGNAAAGAALRTMRTRWEDVLRPHVRDQAALDLVILVSDGLYFNNALSLHDALGVAEATAAVPRGAALDALIALVVRTAALPAVDDDQASVSSI
ncbi:TetR/AcrR family transcriptional regulator [Microbacterium sp. W1N]|nr:TetR/AcrR family transcriptional regulator [Microbacterium festucae]